MIEVSLFIPLASNRGSRFSRGHHDAFEQFVLDRFSGVSKLGAEVLGAWRSEGKTFRDPTVVWVVAVDGLLNDAEALREVIRFAKKHYEQLAIYVRYLGQAEVI